MGYGDKCYQMAPWVTSNKKNKGVARREAKPGRDDGDRRLLKARQESPRQEAGIRRVALQRTAPIPNAPTAYISAIMDVQLAFNHP